MVMLHADPRKVEAGFPVDAGPAVLGPGCMERCGTGTNALVCPISVGTKGAPRFAPAAHTLRGSEAY
jgi:hypothetical protein